MHSVTSVVSNSVTLWTVARQAPLSTSFSRQGYWSGLLCPSPGDLPNPGIEPMSLMSPASAGEFFTTSDTWKAKSNKFLSFFFPLSDIKELHLLMSIMKKSYDQPS